MIAGIPYLSPAVPAIVSHHERWDGTGYPDGLKAGAIPGEARLLAVVDTFDAMTSDRPYHRAMDSTAAFNEITSRAGVQFDPAMVEAFRTCWEQGAIQNITAAYEALMHESTK